MYYEYEYRTSTGTAVAAIPYEYRTGTPYPGTWEEYRVQQLYSVLLLVAAVCTHARTRRAARSAAGGEARRLS